MQSTVLARCQAVFAGWQGLTVDDFEFADPKGFSSFTMGVRAIDADVQPPAALYRHLAGKDNAILDFATEREVFLLLGRAGIAAHCHHYDDTCRIEEFYEGRTLTAAEVLDPVVQKGIAAELWRFHHLTPDGLPAATFFELLHDQWGAIARRVLGEHRDDFPEDERSWCDSLAAIHEPQTLEMVRRCLPESAPVFCHNDTYHGNVMRLDDGRIRLLDFEFSCRNHVAFDFANLFAETVMQHGLEEPPHFRIGEPDFTDDDLASLVDHYLAHAHLSPDRRAAERRALVADTRRCLMLSDFMYAMAALPLALEPIQRIRFLPYAGERFARFLAAWDTAFGRR